MHAHRVGPRVPFNGYALQLIDRSAASLTVHGIRVVRDDRALRTSRIFGEPGFVGVGIRLELRAEIAAHQPQEIHQLIGQIVGVKVFLRNLTQLRGRDAGPVHGLGPAEERRGRRFHDVRRIGIAPQMRVEHLHQRGVGDRRPTAENVGLVPEIQVELFEDQHGRSLDRRDRLLGNPDFIGKPLQLHGLVPGAQLLDCGHVCRVSQGAPYVGRSEGGTFLEAPPIVLAFQEQPLSPVVEDEPAERPHDRVRRLHGGFGVLLLQVSNDGAGVRNECAVRQVQHGDPEIPHRRLDHLAPAVMCPGNPCIGGGLGKVDPFLDQVGPRLGAVERDVRRPVDIRLIRPRSEGLGRALRPRARDGRHGHRRPGYRAQLHEVSSVNTRRNFFFVSSVVTHGNSSFGYRPVLLQ